MANITPAPGWLDVPQLEASTQALGGPDGPMNYQAKSLAARTELLRIDVREVLRRICAEAGYNLVDGSFEQGATVTAVTDVVAYWAEGRVYGWHGAFPFTVPENSTPAGNGGIGPTGWEDKSSATLRAALATTSGAGMVRTASGATVQESLDALDTPWETDTATSGTINAATKVHWLADTTAARSRTLGDNLIELMVKDITGQAETNVITLTAPAGKTINGAASETIDANFGWAHYVLVGTDFKIIGGQ